MPVLYSNKYRPALLKLGDGVTFYYDKEQYNYEVAGSHLRDLRTPIDNARIFKALGLNKNLVASIYYTYEPPSGQADNAWPECEEGDYNALTRLVNHLYYWIDEKNRSTKDSPEKKEANHSYSIDDAPIRLLKLGDKVTFKVSGVSCVHEVKDRYLNHCEGKSNATIFSILHVDKRSISRGCYLYDPVSFEEPTNWPEFKSGDFAAATRLVNFLFEMIRKIGKYDIPGNKYKFKVEEVKEDNDSGLLINNLKQSTNGNTIETKAVTPTIVGGQKISGCRVPGKTIRASTTSRHLSYREIFG